MSWLVFSTLCRSTISVQVGKRPEGTFMCSRVQTFERMQMGSFNLHVEAGFFIVGGKGLVLFFSLECICTWVKAWIV